jgi:cytochrome c5
VDVWVASASVSDSGSAHAYLVPLSLAGIDERVVIALESDSRTARNVIEHGMARLALGPTRGVVIIDAVLDQAIHMDDVPVALAERYADQADWDPRTARGRFVFVVLRPDRIQAWREVNELARRTLMRAGSWVV